MSFQDEKVLNHGHKEAGADDPTYCRGDNQIIGTDTELLMDIINDGRRFNKSSYEIAMEILREFKRKEKPKCLFSDEEIDDLKLIVEDSNESK